MPKESSVTKEKILTAAETVFSAKGFDKARMEDIAREAGITKVMLYYHFKSKENIMREMLSWMLAQARQKFQSAISPMFDAKKFRPEFAVAQMESILAPRKPMMRILISEGMKGTIPMSEIIGILIGFFDTVRDSMGAIKHVRDRETFFCRMFFFNSLPGLMYFLIGDDFAKALNADEKRIRGIFTKKFGETLKATIFH